MRLSPAQATFLLQVYLGHRPSDGARPEVADALAERGLIEEISGGVLDYVITQSGDVEVNRILGGSDLCYLLVKTSGWQWMWWDGKRNVTTKFELAQPYDDESAAMTERVRILGSARAAAVLIVTIRA